MKHDFFAANQMSSMRPLGPVGQASASGAWLAQSARALPAPAWRLHVSACSPCHASVNIVSRVRTNEAMLGRHPLPDIGQNSSHVL